MVVVRSDRGPGERASARAVVRLAATEAVHWLEGPVMAGGSSSEVTVPVAPPVLTDRAALVLLDLLRRAQTTGDDREPKASQGRGVPARICDDAAGSA